MSLDIGKDVKIHPTAIIDIRHGKIGPRTIIEAYAILRGLHVEIGTESWIGHHAEIGGGSCYDREAFLKTGDWFHLGPFAHINTARGVTIGNEVGIGNRSCVFTHGAYLSVMEGFPVQWSSVVIGDKVWIPHAWINPNVTIGDNVVVAAMSLVNKNLPSGCLAGGIPVKILKRNAYPNIPPQTDRWNLFSQISRKVVDNYGSSVGDINFAENQITVMFEGNMTVFDLGEKTIIGAANQVSELVKDQLRRNGVRFKYYAKDGEYTRWET